MEDSTARVWEAATGKELFPLKGHRDFVWAARFSPDGKRIVTGGRDKRAIVWESASGKALLTFNEHSDVISSAAFSPDGLRIVTGSDDHTARMWDAADGKALLTFKGHTATIRSVAFSSDGQRIVTGSFDRTARVWEAASGKELLTLRGHSAWIWSVAFSPDGQRIVTGSWDHTARVWEAATAHQVASWQQEEKSAAQRFAVVRREEAAEVARQRALLAKDPGAIKQWLVLAPIPYDSTNAAVALDQPQIPDEPHLRPRANQHETIGQREWVWSSLRQEYYVIDFNELLRKMTDFSVAYAVTYTASDNPLAVG